MKGKLYFMYKTTNIKNDKFYIGVHETFNLEDGYLGSGKRFKNSLYYHGKENFKREILEYFDNSKSMYSREQEIVNEELLKNPKCLNLVLGGKGGFNHLTIEQRKIGQKAGGKSTSLKFKTDLEFRKNVKDKLSKSLIKAHKSGTASTWQNSFSWKDKTHSNETKKKMRESAKGRYTGTKNSQYGTCWITDEIISKKINKDTKIPNGFRLGRVVKIK